MKKSKNQVEKEAKECKQIFLASIKDKGFYDSSIIQASMEIFLSGCARSGLSFKILKDILNHNKDNYESILKEAEDGKT